MVLRVAICLLAITLATQGASLAPLDLIDNLQEFLINPEVMGVRMKRSVSDDWDKEFDLDFLGLGFKLKYNDPANPMKGGHAHVKFPGKRFVTKATFDDVELDIVFNGGDYIDGLFDMKVDYKFVQKFTFLADRPQDGSIMIYRKLEGGVWKTKMSVDNNNRQPNPFFDVTVETDRQTKLYATFQYDDDNKWEMKIDRVPGSSITGVFIVNGVEHTLTGTLDTAARKLNVQFLGCEKTYNLDFQLTPGGKWGFIVTGEFDGPVDVKMTIQKDYKKVDLVAKYNNKNYAFVKLTGDAVVKGVFPEKVDYTMKYNILDSKMEGKAKINFDAGSPKKTLKLSFVPKVGQDLTVDYTFEITANNGWKADYEATRAGVSYFKWVQVYDIVANNRNTFEAATKDVITMIPQSLFYNFFCSYVGKCFTTATRERKIVYSKTVKNFVFGKMEFDDTATVDGERFQQISVDSTRTPYTLTWYRPTGPTYMYNTQSLFGLDQVEVKVWHTIGKELKVETNIEDIKVTVRRDPDYFVEFVKKGETMVKSHTEITPAMFVTDIDTLLYLPSTDMFDVPCSMSKFLYGNVCFTKREGHMKVVVDRLNTNALLNKFSIEHTIKKDDDLMMDFSMSTMVTPFTFHLNAPYILPKFFNDDSRTTIEATATHVLGDTLEIKSNCPEMETFKITTAGVKRTVQLNGRELMVFDFTTGEKKISQTTNLPSGEPLTTTVEWTRDSVKRNKVLVTVVVSPERKFEGTFDWDLRRVSYGNLEMAVKGVNPWVGEYEITRKGDWETSPAVVNFNWVGHTVFTTGPIATFTPMDTQFKVNLDRNSMNLDADMVKTFGGKKWGFTVANNKFSVLTGRA